ncbi:MAG: Gfo/Idh/MocA family oxidoreductase [Chloroherpetonaceae bacterium]|nr:Gfo/Idh/MocA family oxidoreductase [Chthonomonadaceae bacterium]MDW8208665.1 Gfo/Idh/MocA family oxidoreductase [Chloroherpetonaceae bacterium]
MNSKANDPTRLRAGIIGCGWFGRVHLERLSEIPGIAVCAVSDPDPAARRKLAERVPELMRDQQGTDVADYASAEELMQHPGLDFVVIASPNRWHVPQVLAALEHGLHVLCEKPLSLVPEEVTQVAEATERSDRIVAIAYQSRYRRDSRLLREALRSGRWGRITSIDVFACEDWVTPNVGTWRHDPERCPGGYFGDANGHQLDLLFHVTGLEASRLRATMENRGTPVPIVTWGEARLRPQSAATAPPRQTDDVPFTFTFVGDAKHWREEISIQTERADFVMRNTRLLWTDSSADLRPFTEEDLSLSAPVTSDTPDSAFVRALRGGEPVVSAPGTVWPVLRFTLGALASAAQGGVEQHMTT